MATIKQARALLEIEVRDCMLQTPIESKNEGWIQATMDAATEYGQAVHDIACTACRINVNWHEMCQSRPGYYCISK